MATPISNPMPAIVFVPGAWHAPETWAKVIEPLQALSYECVAVDLPTTQSTDRGFSDDVRAVRQAIEIETAKGRDVVVVVHSYGGTVGPSAIKGLTTPGAFSTSSSDSRSGHVIGIVAIATGFLPTGVGFLEAGGGKPPPIWKLDEEHGTAVITVDPRELFYHDMPKNEGEFWVSKLRIQSLKAFTDGTDAYAGWMDVPVWYVVTKQDKGLPYQTQMMLAQIARDAGADVTVQEIDSSHSPMLSKPMEVVREVTMSVQSFQLKSKTEG